jgi:hypothetical protein
MHPRVRALLACCVVTTLIAAGCGGDGRPEMIPVTGKVTFNGAKPPGPGTLWFTIDEAAPGFPSRPATGDFDAEGNYSAKTFEPGDGLIPGKYKIRIDCWEVPPTMGGPPAKSFVPAKYQSPQTSELTVEIAPGEDAKEVNFDVVKATR